MDDRSMHIKEIHWLMDMLQTIDVGLIVLDRDYRVRVWNGFMENHSGRKATHVIGTNLFKTFPDIPEPWFRRKVDSVLTLASRSFTTWEQRPYLLRFKNYRPITGTAEFMYQNITIIPLVSADGVVNHVGIIIYDVTDIALGKSELKDANARLARLSRTDQLTELNNRGYWEDCLRSEFARFRRTRHVSSLVMFDIDHFKKVNDTYGHQAGDEVIRTTARILREAIRNTDISGRYGGEEFGIILVNTSVENGMILAERLRKKIEATTVTFEQREIRYTISLGLAEVTEAMKDHTEWLGCSDQALYQAKRSGRNQALIFTD
jgi:diguanylate cyclase (GGDEF)-like protein